MNLDKQRFIDRIAHFIDTFGSDKKSHKIKANQSSSSIKYFEFSEAVIRYKIVGNGKHTLVLATDPPIVIEHYDELLKHLENDFRVIVFEVPGFGFSFLRKEGSFTFKNANDLMAKFLQKLGLGPYLLAFPCVIGLAAIDIANRFPEMVKGVAVMQTPSWEEEVKWKHQRDPKGILAKPVLGQIGLQILKRKRSPEWIKAAIGKQEKLDEFLQKTDDAFANGACFCLASAFQHYLTDTPQNLSAVQQPSLIFWGEADKSHRKTDKSSTAIYCPQAETVFFEQAGHFPELEEPEMFSQKLKDWTKLIK
jgi:pimeloyl-ACP methyl ester carboxylesterase